MSYFPHMTHVPFSGTHMLTRTEKNAFASTHRTYTPSSWRRAGTLAQTTNALVAPAALHSHGVVPTTAGVPEQSSVVNASCTIVLAVSLTWHMSFTHSSLK